MECDRVSHMLLKLKMGIVEENFIRIACSDLKCHVVHALVSIEIQLGHRFRHSSWHGAYSSTLACTSCNSRFNWHHITSHVRRSILLRSVIVFWHLQSLQDAVFIQCSIKGIVLSCLLALRNTAGRVYKGRSRLWKSDEKWIMRFCFNLRMNDLLLTNGVYIA